MILHIPHSAAGIPPDILDQFQITETELETENNRIIESFTSDIFNSREAVPVIYPFSRLVVDPEPEREARSKNLGEVYRQTFRGTPLRKEITPDVRQGLIDRFYQPHHARLTACVHKELEEFGHSLIIDCHSFSVTTPAGVNRAKAPAADICLGTDQYHTPQWLIGDFQRLCEIYEYSVELNHPDTGTLVPAEFYRSNPEVVSLMIDLNCNLYMNAATGRKKRTFLPTRAKMYSILNILWQVFLTHYRCVAIQGKLSPDTPSGCRCI